MKLFILFKKIEGVINYNYNYHVSSMIYKLLKNTEYDKLHNDDIVGKFTFYLDINKSSLGIKIDNNISLIISSSNSNLINILEDKFKSNKILQIDKCILSVLEVKKNELKIEKNSALLEAVTPINISHKENGKKYEQYIHPLDKNYIDIMKKNMIRKSDSNNYTVDDIEIFIPPKQFFKSQLIDIKNIKIKGYKYKFMVKAPSDLLKNCIDNGFGIRNSQGFGFVNILKLEHYGN